MFSLFRLYRNSMPWGASSGVEVVIEYMTTGASCPGNLSTVPTLAPGSRSCILKTCALYGAIIRISSSVSALFAPSLSIHFAPSSRSLLTRSPTQSASSSEEL